MAQCLLKLRALGEALQRCRWRRSIIRRHDLYVQKWFVNFYQEVMFIQINNTCLSQSAVEWWSVPLFSQFCFFHIFCIFRVNWENTENDGTRFVANSRTFEHALGKMCQNFQYKHLYENVFLIEYNDVFLFLYRTLPQASEMRKDNKNVKCLNWLISLGILFFT